MMWSTSLDDTLRWSPLLSTFDDMFCCSRVSEAEMCPRRSFAASLQDGPFRVPT